ncbi:TPA: protein rep, partial [Staphylococcus aureus LTCF-3-23]|nr:protein rep [Staphylococcus aureus LTCF-3-23]
VENAYFRKKKYITQTELVDLWQQALKVNYRPVVNIKAIKPKRR